MLVEMCLWEDQCGLFLREPGYVPQISILQHAWGPLEVLVVYFAASGIGWFDAVLHFLFLVFVFFLFR